MDTHEWSEAKLTFASKKQIVDFLQQNASAAFLSSRGLLGSPSNVIKKTGKPTLEKAYRDLFQSKENFAFDKKDNEENKQKILQEKAQSLPPPEPAKKPEPLPPLLELFPYDVDDQEEFQKNFEGTELTKVPSDLYPVIAAYLLSMRGKQPDFSVAVLGHVDSGRSTLEFRLMWALEGVGPRERQKYLAEACQTAYDRWVDANRPERCGRGVVISCVTKEFFTPSKHYIMTDPPTTRNSLKNLISGAVDKHLGILVVPADHLFALTIAKGNPDIDELPGGARYQSLLALKMGFKQLIVCVNKMDGNFAHYKEERFLEICTAVKKMLLEVGYTNQFLEGVPFIPISATQDQNITTFSPKMDIMPWWKGTDVKIRNRWIHVNTLADALELTVFPQFKPTHLPLRVPISGVYKIKGIGDVLTGRPQQGTLYPNIDVKFVPSHSEQNPCCARILSIERHHKQVPCAYPDDNAGFHVDRLSLNRANMPKVGDIMVWESDQSLLLVTSFTATITVLPENERKVGCDFYVYPKTRRAKVTMSKINWKISPQGGRTQRIENPDSLKWGDSAEVVFEVKEPLVVAPFKDCEWLGHVVLLDIATPGNVVMIASITEVEH